MANNNVLVIGSGNREYALCWKLACSPKVETVYVIPGNVDIAKEKKVCLVADVSVSDVEAVTNFSKHNAVGLVVIGAEDPLANTIAEELGKADILCFGPSMAATMIETNDDWTKAFMDRHSIPSAQSQKFPDPKAAMDFVLIAPFTSLVVKASGLAAGKAIVAANNQEAFKEVERILDEKEIRGPREVVIEELLVGEEVTLMAFTDGDVVKMMLPIHDHKSVIDTNVEGFSYTGGVGAVCSCNFIKEEEKKLVEEQIMVKAVNGFKLEGIPFRGVLYAVVVMTGKGPKLLKLQGKYSDRETRILLPLLHSDLYDIMQACCLGRLSETDVLWVTRNAASSDTGGQVELNQASVSESPVPDWFKAINRDLRTEFEKRFAKLERQNELQELMLAQLYLMQNTSTTMNCILAFKPPLYRKTSFETLSKNLLIILSLQDDGGNLFLPFVSFYQAIGILGVQFADGFLPFQVQEAAKSCLHLEGQKLEHHLLWVFKILQELGDTIWMKLKVECNHSILLQHTTFTDSLKILGIQVEMAPTLNSQLIKLVGNVKLQANWPMFDSEDTVKDRFFHGDGNSTIIDMMNSKVFTAVCGTWENARYVVVPLDQNLNVILLKAQVGYGVKDMETHFSKLLMHQLVSGKAQKRVRLGLPKFAATSRFIDTEFLKLVVDLSESSSKFKSLLGADGPEFSMTTEVIFTEGFDDQLQQVKRCKYMGEEEQITFNNPFWVIVYYKQEFPVLAARVDLSEGI